VWVINFHYPSSLVKLAYGNHIILTMGDFSLVYNWKTCWSNL